MSESHLNLTEEPLRVFGDEQPGEDEANAYREAAVRAIDFFKRAEVAVYAYKSDRRFAMDCLLLTLEWYDILGCNSQVELAVRWGCTKAAVNNAVMYFQNALGQGLSPLPAGCSQRREASRENMRQARVKQAHRPAREESWT